MLLGEAWKSLPQEERDGYSQRAKVKLILKINWLYFFKKIQKCTFSYCTIKGYGRRAEEALSRLLEEEEDGERDLDRGLGGLVIEGASIAYSDLGDLGGLATTHDGSDGRGCRCATARRAHLGKGLS